MADDEAVAGTPVKSWLIAGKGLASEEEVDAVYDRQDEAAAAIAALLDAAGPLWTANFLRKELAKIEPPRPRRGRPRAEGIDPHIFVLLRTYPKESDSELARRFWKPGESTQRAFQEQLTRARRKLRERGTSWGFKQLCSAEMRELAAEPDAALGLPVGMIELGCRFIADPAQNFTRAEREILREIVLPVMRDAWRDTPSD